MNSITCFRPLTGSLWEKENGLLFIDPFTVEFPSPDGELVGKANGSYEIVSKQDLEGFRPLTGSLWEKTF